MHFISLIHDISVQKRAEEMQRETELRFRQVTDNIRDVFWLTDPAKSEMLYVSPAYEAIWGRTVHTLYSSPLDWLNAIHPEDRERVAVAARMKQITGRYDETFRIVRPDGSVRWVRDRAFPVHDEQQRVVRVAGVAEDVTESTRVADELERTIEKLRHAVQSTIQTISLISELRDPYTYGHERRVGEIAAAIATEMAFSADRIEGVRVAGYLHDVGKIAVPAEMLSKPTRLSSNELALVREHAQKSYEILKGVDFPWPIAEAAWQHHERLDGSGYPRGLKGGEIMLEARLLAVADTVEAMASHRPYRAALGVDEALAEIERNRGKHFDPAVVDACLRLFRVKGYRLPA